LECLKTLAQKQFEAPSFHYEDTVAKLIVDFPHYAVTESGLILSFKRRQPRYLKAALNNGHLYVCLVRDRLNHYSPVSLFVGRAFIVMPEGRYNVKHIDGNGRNCQKDNLEWAFPKNHFESMVSNKETLTLERKRELLSPFKFEARFRCFSEPKLLTLLTEGVPALQAIRQVAGVSLKRPFLKTLSAQQKRQLGKEGLLS